VSDSYWTEAERLILEQALREAEQEGFERCQAEAVRMALIEAQRLAKIKTHEGQMEASGASRVVSILRKMSEGT
jgi:DNA-binding protein H-NS